jgi:hypothetical protein
MIMITDSMFFIDPFPKNSVALTMTRYLGQLLAPAKELGLLLRLFCTSEEKNPFTMRFFFGGGEAFYVNC